MANIMRAYMLIEGICKPESTSRMVLNKKKEYTIVPMYDPKISW